MKYAFVVFNSFDGIVAICTCESKAHKIAADIAGGYILKYLANDDSGFGVRVE